MNELPRKKHRYRVWLDVSTSAEVCVDVEAEDESQAEDLAIEKASAEDFPVVELEYDVVHVKCLYPKPEELADEEPEEPENLRLRRLGVAALPGWEPLVYPEKGMEAKV